MDKNIQSTSFGYPCDATSGTNTTRSILTTNTNTSTSGGGNARARAREGISEIDLETLNESYFEAFRRSAPAPIVAVWQRYSVAGMETSLFLRAIDETLLAPYPSPRYMLAVLGRWMRDGILTDYQRAAEQERREAWIARQHQRRDEERYGYRETAWGSTVSTRTGEIIE